jgi:hypothetical protein
MISDERPSDEPTTPDPAHGAGEIDDQTGLKSAHGRTGRMLKLAGLPFEEDEFDDDGGGTEHTADDAGGSGDAPATP